MPNVSASLHGTPSMRRDGANAHFICQSTCQVRERRAGLHREESRARSAYRRNTSDQRQMYSQTQGSLRRVLRCFPSTSCTLMRSTSTETRDYVQGQEDHGQKLSKGVRCSRTWYDPCDMPKLGRGRRAGQNMTRNRGGLIVVPHDSHYAKNLSVNIVLHRELDHPLSVLTTEHHTSTQDNHAPPRLPLLRDFGNWAAIPILRPRCIWRFLVDGRVRMACGDVLHLQESDGRTRTRE